MSFNIPFIAVNKLLNVEDYITGKIATKSFRGGGSGGSPAIEEDDDELPPILAPQPVPGLLLDHSKIEASRTRVENVWNTKKDFLTTESRKLCCLYCGMKLLFHRADSSGAVNRWFLPTRRERRMELVEELSGDEEDTEETERPREEPSLSPTVSYVYFGEGVFCTYYCTFMHASTKKMKAEATASCLKLLKLMCQDFSGRAPPVIDIQIVKDHLEKYGGFLSEQEFRENALRYEPK